MRRTRPSMNQVPIRNSVNVDSDRHSSVTPYLLLTYLKGHHIWVLAAEGHNMRARVIFPGLNRPMLPTQSVRKQYLENLVSLVYPIITTQ